MEMFLKDLENVNKNNLISDCNEEISFVVYIASLTEDIVTLNDIQTASKIMHFAIAKISKNNHNVIENLLQENDRNQYITLANCNQHIYKIRIRNKWLFQLILLSSIKHSEIFYANKKIEHDTTNFLRFSIRQITKHISIEKPNSVHLLRTLLLILTKYNEVLTHSLSLNILECMGRAALSPVTGFKHYAQSISKLTIPSLTNEDKNKFLDIDLLPVRGVDMYDITKLFPNEYIKENKCKIVKKVLKLFLNNTESKDGGSLYESVLVYSFEEWKVEIWPLFLNDLKNVEYEGEFFQSLRKYWIPLNVSIYKNEFYLFLKNEPIDTNIKAYVLLESRRKGYTIDSCNSNDVLHIVYNIETANLCLKLVSTYHKKSLCPNHNEMAVVQNYLYSNLNRVLEDEPVKSLQSFFSQIFLHAHVNLRKDKENLMVYASVVDSMYQFCRNSLKTDFCEVGAQVLLILWNIATGSHKSLNVPYKMEKKDFYEEGENVLYKDLQSRHIWKFQTLTEELWRCFIKNQGCGANIAKLLYKYYLQDLDMIDVKYLKNVIDKETTAKLQNIEKIKNHSELLFRSTSCRKEISEFLEYVKNILYHNLYLTKENCCDESIFKNIILMEILMVAVKNKLDVQISHETIEKCLDVVDFILENKFLSGRGYKSMKVLEAFINSIMLCVVQNKDHLWASMNKKKVLDHLISIIQRSNMKRPVSLSIEVLKHFGAKMDENESDRALKIQFLDKILKSLYKTPTKQELKIRRNPESRLVIHAMCSSEKNPNKPLLKWVLNFLLDVIKDTTSSDSSISSALHSIEILVSDNNLHGCTLPFIYPIIVQCVELFEKPSWIVRNADLQLAKALIERFYGVSINSCDRPKNIEDLFVLFPNLSTYFFKVLAADELDERAVLVFQFFFEGQIREHLFMQDASKVFRDCFLILLADIIKKYPNNYGKLAVRSYTSLCAGREIPKIMLDLTDFLKDNYGSISKNIFANFVFLLRELYDKYTYGNCDKRGLAVINSMLVDLLKHLRAFDSPLFSFLLFKIQPTNVALKEIELLGSGLQDDYEKRLWLHNYIPFVLVNAKSNEISNILHQILSPKMLYCMQVKALSILVSKFENDEFNNDTLIDILKVLFEKSVLIDDSESYVLNCYFKTILLICERIQSVSFVKKSLPYKPTSSLYKTMISVLYFSGEKSQVIDIEQQDFYKQAELLYLNSISLSEDVGNDIASTLTYFKQGAPKQFYFNLLRLVFYFSVRHSTCLEAYSFISASTNRTYCSILHALKAFLSVRHLARYLQDENLVAKFLLDVNLYVDNVPGDFEDFDGYYSVESDNLVPRLFLKKLLRSSADHDDI